MAKKTKIEKQQFYEGEITGFSGNWLSGIAILFINEKPVHCENAPTVRALESCFGNIIQAGHCASVENVIGEGIVFCFDEMGLLLAGFMPSLEFYDSIFDNETMEITEY
jgi:hypothetical protein